MNITCFIRYQIDPFQESLAAYEAYRARLKADAAGRENFTFARERRFILREERSYVENVRP